MNLLPVHDKLAEAKFFLAHITQEQEKTTLHRQEDAFRFYLSAFLNAAYSARVYLERSAKDTLKVSGAMQQVSGKQAKAKYPQWQGGWIKNLSASETEVWQLMTTHRSIEVHENRVETIKETKAVPADDLSQTNPYYGYYNHASRFMVAIMAGGEGVDPLTEEKRRLGLPGWCNAWTYTYKHHFIICGKQVGVTDVCMQYYVLLGKLVADFERSEVHRSCQG